jgi:hypothetical protein
VAVFISYNSKDSDVVPAELKRQLDAKLGDCTFFDRASIKPGSEWKKSIESGLERALVAVVVAGPHFFDEREMERLSDSESVIRQELETARLKQDCEIVPVFFECLPPHRSDKSWPDDLAWMGDLQWTEIKRDRLKTDVAVLAQGVCHILANKSVAKLEEHSGPVSLISVVDSVTPEVINAITATLGQSSADEVRLKKSLQLLEQMKTGNLDSRISDAIKSSGSFAGIDLWLRAAYLLRCAAHNNLNERIADIEAFDHKLRPLAEAVPGEARGSFLRFADRKLEEYLSIVVRRLRERLETTCLDAPLKLENYFAEIRDIDQQSFRRLDRAIVILNRWGIAIDPSDVEPFLGRGRLRDVIQRPRGDERGPQRARGRRRGRRNRRRHGKRNR